MRIVVAGAGMVGHRFVEEALRLDDTGELEVVLVGAEEYEPYNRILLSEVLAGRCDFKALHLPLPDARVDFRRGVSVSSIDRSGPRVLLSDGSSVAYDALVLATGARAFVPPLPGLDESPRHVHVLRSIDDCRDLTARAVNAKHAVVLGGGVLGIEAACGLRRRGVPVTVLDLDATVMATQLDAGPGSVLAGRLGDLGVDVRTGMSIAEVISAYDELVAVRLTDGSMLAADLLLVSCGVRAEAGLAADAGLPVERGIVVDDALATEDPHIFAIGDCAQPPSGMTGLLAPGWRQAAQLAEHLVVGAAAERPPVEDEGIKLKAAGVDLVALGVRASAARTTDRVITVSDPVGRRHIDLVVRDGGLAGVTCLGAGDVAASLSVAFDRRTPLPTDPLALLVPERRTEESSPLRMPGSTTVCRCNTVTKKEIVTAWEGGAETVEAVAATTRATTGCGGCREVVCGLVDWLNSTDPAAPQPPSESSQRPAADVSPAVARA